MVQRKTVSHFFASEDLKTIKAKMLNWLRPFSIFAYLDNNEYAHQPNRFELLVGVGAVQLFDHLPDAQSDWLFGHFAYDYKNVVEPQLSSRFESHINFEDCRFFQPEIVVSINRSSSNLVIASLTTAPETVLQQILEASSKIETSSNEQTVRWQHYFSEEEYIESVTQIRRHIEEGDCYEMNFCTGAHTNAGIDPFSTFYKLNHINPSPFAALYRNESVWSMCASPERFVYRDKDKVTSQPIKGTARRSPNSTLDRALKEALLLDEKERAENVMIVDLVRNDLAKSCEVGSIQVPELFGVYSFPQVHQLISTVVGKLKKGISNTEIIKNAFPMGSMTGAPKVMVMQLIEQYERCRRNLYSGTIGYITPENDFDFNVVIRGLFYNEESKFLSYHTGGAITYDSVPAQEWEEVRLKAKAMEQIFL